VTISGGYLEVVATHRWWVSGGVCLCGGL